MAIFELEICWFSKYGVVVVGFISRFDVLVFNYADCGVWFGYLFCKSMPMKLLVVILDMFCWVFYVMLLFGGWEKKNSKRKICSIRIIKAIILHCQYLNWRYADSVSMELLLFDWSYEFLFSVWCFEVFSCTKNVDWIWKNCSWWCFLIQDPQIQIEL